MGQSGVDYCLAPDSLRSWFTAFARLDPQDRVFYLGDAEIVPAETEAMIGWHEGHPQRVIVLSSHDSFLRDLGLAERLRSRGRDVACQTPEGARLGLDKLAQKRVLERIGAATPSWGEVGSLTGSSHNLLLKRRRLTQSQGIGWHRGEAPTDPEEWYWEEFVSGCEYSVLALVGNEAPVLFPIVAKGETRTDLLPPWQRVRRCPDPTLDPVLESSLLSATRKILGAIVCWGFVELEFVVDERGLPLLLEINPRVSGTLRLAAMACDADVFSIVADSEPWPSLVSRRQALEVPYDGLPFVAPDRRVVASSRITFAADTTDELFDLAARHLGDRPDRLGQIRSLLAASGPSAVGMPLASARHAGQAARTKAAHA